jgi:hypothetical protein
MMRDFLLDDLGVFVQKVFEEFVTDRSNELRDVNLFKRQQDQVEACSRVRRAESGEI